MKVTNMNSPRTGKPVANQYIITTEGHGALGNFTKREVFQSYDSIIATRTIWRHEDVVGHGGKEIEVELDEKYWDYSRTTAKYRNIFLGESTADTKKNIASGEYKFTDLN